MKLVDPTQHTSRHQYVYAYMCTEDKEDNIQMQNIAHLHWVNNKNNNKR